MDIQEQNQNIPQALLNEIRSLETGIQQRPEGSEKCIILLKLYSLLNSQGIPLSHSQIISPFSENCDNYLTTTIREILNHLKEENQFLDDIPRKLEAFKNFASKHDWKQALFKINEVIRSFMQVDLVQTLDLIKQGTEKTAPLENKDINVFLSNTGAGKSTAIQYLSRAKFEKKSDFYFVPEKTENDMLNLIEVSNRVTSETLGMNFVEVKYRSSEKNKFGNPMEKNAILVDSPGFNDTRGPAIEISNNVILSKTLRKAKSVRPVVVINQNGFGERGSSLGKTLVNISNMMTDFRNDEASFKIVYSYATEDFRKTIVEKLGSLKQEAEKNGNHAESHAYYVAEQITKNRLIHIDPMDPSQIDDILDFINNPKEAIRNPAASFKIFITEGTRAILKKQLDREIGVVLACIESANFEYAAYKIEILQQFALEIEIYKDLFEELLRKISENFRDSILKSCKFVVNLMKSFCDLKEKNFAELLILQDNLQKGKEFYSKILASEDFEQNKLAETLLTMIKNEINMEFNFCNSEDYLNASRIFKTIQYLSLMLKDKQFQEYYEEFILRNFRDQIEKFLKDFELKLSSHAYKYADESFSSFSQVKKAFDFLKTHDFNFDQVSEKMKSLLKNHFETMLKTVSKSKRETWEKLPGIMEKFNSIKYCKNIHENISEFENSYQTLLNDILTKNINDTERMVDNNPESEILEKAFKDLSVLINIPEFEEKVSKCYDKFSTAARNKLDKILETLKNLFEKDQHSQTRKYNEVANCISDIRKFEWLQLHSKVYDNAVDMAKRAIRNRVVELKDKLYEVKLSWDARSSYYEEGNRILDELNQLKKFSGEMPEIVESLGCMKEFFDKNKENMKKALDTKIPKTVGEFNNGTIKYLEKLWDYILENENLKFFDWIGLINEANSMVQEYATSLNSKIFSDFASSIASIEKYPFINISKDELNPQSDIDKIKKYHELLKILNPEKNLYKTFFSEITLADFNKKMADVFNIIAALKGRKGAILVKILGSYRQLDYLMPDSCRFILLNDQLEKNTEDAIKAINNCLEQKEFNEFNKIKDHIARISNLDGVNEEVRQILSQKFSQLKNQASYHLSSMESGCLSHEKMLEFDQCLEKLFLLSNFPKFICDNEILDADLKKLQENRQIIFQQEIPNMEEFKINRLSEYQSKILDLEKIANDASYKNFSQNTIKVTELKKLLRKNVIEYIEKILSFDIATMNGYHLKKILSDLQNYDRMLASKMEDNIETWLYSQLGILEGLKDISKKINAVKDIKDISKSLEEDNRFSNLILKISSKLNQVEDSSNQFNNMVEEVLNKEAWISSFENLFNAQLMVEDENFQRALAAFNKRMELILSNLKRNLEKKTINSDDFHELVECQSRLTHSKIKPLVENFLNMARNEISSRTSVKIALIKKFLEQSTFELPKSSKMLENLLILFEIPFLDSSLTDSLKGCFDDVLEYIHQSEAKFNEALNNFDTSRFSHLSLVNSDILTKLIKIDGLKRKPSTYEEINAYVIEFAQKLDLCNWKMYESNVKNSPSHFLGPKTAQQFKFIQFLCTQKNYKNLQVKTINIETIQIGIMNLFIEAQDKTNEFLLLLANPKHSFTQECLAILAKNLEIMKSCSSHFKDVIKGDFDLPEKLKKSLEDEIIKYQHKISDKDINYHAELLIKWKKFSKFLVDYHKLFEDSIVKYVDNFTIANGNQKFFTLAAVLEKDPSGFGIQVIIDNPKYRCYENKFFKKNTENKGIRYVVDHMGFECFSINRNKLEEAFSVYNDSYMSLISQFLKGEITTDNILNQVKEMVAEKTFYEMKPELPTLLAYLFAYISYSRSKEFLSDYENSVLFQAHPAQIVALFRMFGIEENVYKLSNHLIQVPTGEGKSVILAAASCVFALFGYDVSCVCYSEYLSKRDFDDFQQLFNFFGVQNSVSYGTINEQCEKFINRNIKVRAAVEDWISKGTFPVLAEAFSQKKESIILIDEVDVFFQKEFVGNPYRISGQVSHPSLIAVMDLIWANREKDDLGRTIFLSPEYVNCEKVFEPWKDLIQSSVRAMVQAVKNFNEPKYEIKNDKIAYLDGDQYSTNIHYGYKTLFAYYDAHDKTRISSRSFKENKTMNITCGDFCYAEIVKKFDHIVGLSGTLKDLSNEEKKIISKDYKISYKTFIPSVYGDPKLDFNPKNDIKIFEEKDYYNQILKDIKAKIGQDRAVLVFFESIEDLKKFIDNFKNNELPAFETITESTEENIKKSLVLRASLKRNLTLLTKCFGRGTDFICRDQNVNKNGGVHVIQTFMAESLADETQLKGRTARQGEKGSYCMILKKNSLEKFLITDSDLQQTLFGNTVYENLNAKRNNHYELRYKANNIFVDEIMPKHKASVEFIENLKNGNKVPAQEFLNEMNKKINSDKTLAKIVLAVDGTGSMSRFFINLKAVLNKMFSNSSEILKMKRIEGDFEMQLVVYRNYNAKMNKLLEKSSWESEPLNLVKFLNKIQTGHGVWNEAVECGLWHALSEIKAGIPVSHVILIGDMPPNTPEEIKKNRHILGEEYWKTTEAKDIPHVDEIVADLAARKVPINSFYLNKLAASSFNEISRKTDGKSEPLDVNSEEGAQNLLDSTSKTILQIVAKNYDPNNPNLASDLVNEYQNRFERVRVS